MRRVDQFSRPSPLAGRLVRLPPARPAADTRRPAGPAPARTLIEELLDPSRRRLAENQAAQSAVAPLAAAVALGLVTDTALAEALARRLGGYFADTTRLAGMTVAADPDAWLAVLRRGYAPVVLDRGMKAFLIAAEPADAERLAAAPERIGAYGLPVFVATPAGFEALIRRQFQAAWADEAIHGLKRRSPEASADDRGLMRLTALVTMAALVLVTLSLAVGPPGLAATTGGLIGLIVLGWLGVRLAAGAVPAKALPRRPLTEADLPVYSLLCPLHREEAVVPGLIAALTALAYPRARLDIRLIVEADDHETIAAVRAANPPAHIRTLVLPPEGPRTKPKALMMALPLARGDLLTVYDAEDRPDRHQLREAAETFAAAQPDLVCLQAPLLVANARDSLITRFFAADYAALFLVLLPAFARIGLPIPLGGTSNHFRVGALRACGGWDPHNVTEDADLGFRLAAAGGCIGTIAAPTLEEAPPHFGAWLGQRSRWFKGWLQTLAVLARRRRAFAAGLGIRGSLALVATLAGSLGLALVHPACLLGLAGALALGHPPAWAGAVAVVAIAGHVGTALHLMEGLRRAGQLRLAPCLVLLPLWWLLIGMAAWRAVWQLYRRPFHWEKTMHGLGAPEPAEPAPPTAFDARLVGLARRAEQIVTDKRHLAATVIGHIAGVRLEAEAAGAAPSTLAALERCARIARQAGQVS